MPLTLREKQFIIKSVKTKLGDDQRVRLVELIRAGGVKMTTNESGVFVNFASIPENLQDGDDGFCQDYV